MKPLQLKLSGFKGVRDGLGLDNIEIDLSQLSGLIAFCGTNGSAKTTCLDNLHPYREMPSRGGSFYDHVIGYAKKEFVFEMDGTVYRSLILIEPKQKKQEAYLYVRDGTWIALNKDGKTTTYDEQIEKLMGSSKLFFTSIFRAQGAKPISAQSKAELKELFVELLMLDRYQIMADGAKELRKDEESKVQTAEAWIETQVPVAEGRNEKQEERDRLITQISVNEKSVSEERIKLEAIRQDLSSLEAKKTLQDKDVNRLDDLKAEIVKLDGRVLDIKTSADERLAEIRIRLEEQGKKRARAEKILSGKDEIETKVIQEQELEGSQKSTREEAEGIRKEIECIEGDVTEFNQLRHRAGVLEQKVNAEKAARSREISIMGKEIERIEAVAQKLNVVPCKDMDIVTTCPLVEDAVSAKNDLPMRKRHFANLTSETWVPASLNDLNIAKDKCKRLQGIDEKYKTKKQTGTTLQNRLDTIETQLIEVRQWTKLMPELKLTESSIQETDKEIERLDKDYNEYKNEINKQQTALNEERNLKRQETASILLSADNDLDITTMNRKRNVNIVNDQLTELDAEKTTLSQNLGRVEEGIRNIEKAEKELERLRGEVKMLNVEVSEWLLLEKALGKDGLIALEIDDAGPAISATANELLQACFGTRFMVRIDTTRLSKDGKKVMEVFDIKVLDGESEEEKTIFDLSGGEKVWIQSAITQAIAIRNKELSGRRFLTCMEDEIDGALSRQNKDRFFQMKKKAMELGGFEETIFISQDPEIWEMADSRIMFEKGMGIAIE